MSFDLNALWGTAAQPDAPAGKSRSRRAPTLPTPLKVLKPLLEAEGLFTADALTLSTGTHRHDGVGSQRRVLNTALTNCTYAHIEIPSRNLHILSVSHASDIIFVTNALQSNEEWERMQKKIVSATFHYEQIPAGTRQHPASFPQLNQTGAIMILPYLDQNWRDTLTALLKASPAGPLPSVIPPPK